MARFGCIEKQLNVKLIPNMVMEIYLKTEQKFSEEQC